MQHTIKTMLLEKQNFFENPLAKEAYENCRYVNCEFGNANLEALQFFDCHFTNCNFSLAKLNSTVFRDALFKDCKLLGLSFEHCSEYGLSVRFENCNLNHSMFHKKKLTKTIFNNCQLQEVDFTACDLSNSQFINCDLLNAKFDGTNLEKVDFRSAFNYQIDPTRNKISKAKFSESGLIGLLAAYQIIVE